MKNTKRSGLMLYLVVVLGFVVKAQNRFRNLGSDNYTFFIGGSAQITPKTYGGLRYQGINVELSESHLKEPSPVYKGDFTGVTGTLNVQRFYLDYYYRWTFDRIKIEPIISVGLGYNEWYFMNRLVSEEYLLKTASISLSGKFRFTFFHQAFFEIPALDVFLYTYKNTEPQQQLGDARIAFWKNGGMFNWLMVGIVIPMKF
ncbi:MAG: hypothetical protein PHF92_04595 [Bacteroidales bacterium]|nr:hypothetical protein [Bacteroidales bacterium]